MFSFPFVDFFQTQISHKLKTVEAVFYVLHTNGCANLMSSKTTQQLNLVHFSLQTNPTDIPDQFPQLFDGAMDRIKNRKVTLHIDKSVTSVTQIHRRIPFQVRKDVERELDRLKRLDIIEKVEGPTFWVSPIVAVLKTSGVRLCIDMRKANSAIKRIKHATPTIDDLIADLNGTVVFSKQNMKNVYHKLELDETSRYITTFTILWASEEQKIAIQSQRSSWDISEYNIRTSERKIYPTTSLSTGKINLILT